MEQLIQKALDLLKVGYSEGFIEARLYATRDQDTSIKHIVDAITKAKKIISDQKIRSDQQPDSVKAAFVFLLHRNPFENLTRTEYYAILMEYEDLKGSEALEALAGFYLFALKNIKGDDQTRAIKSTFGHDLNGRHEKIMEPRSADFIKFWKERDF